MLITTVVGLVQIGIPTLLVGVKGSQRFTAKFARNMAFVGFMRLFYQVLLSFEGDII